MNRIRAFFVALALLLVASVGLLVQSAFESARAERQTRQMALAERILDEMERELWAFVRAEEGRPAGQYRFAYIPEGAPLGGPPSIVLSPLAAPPARDWVLGYFQLDSHGEFSSPRVPQDPEEARAYGGGNVSPETRAEVEKLEADVLTALRNAETASPVRLRLQIPPAPEPATEVASADESAASADEPGDEAAFGDYRALQELNRGMKSRPKRMLKFYVSRDEGSESLTVTAHVEGPDGESKQVASTSVPLPRPAAPGGVPPRAALDAGAVPEADAPADAQIDTDGAVRVLPFTGTPVADNRLILTRRVLKRGVGLRQGILIDLGRLADWLDERILGDGPLAHHTRRQFFATSQPAPTEPIESFAYLHQFAEPFDALAVRLAIDPLRQERSTLYLGAISGLLVLAGAVVLLALYRMVAVTVRFAERRSNFAAAVSHELKTPLTSIRLYAEMLRDGMVASDDTRREYYATITDESERLSRLIDNVLEFSKLEQGTRDVNLTAGQIGPVVAEAARVLEPHARAAGFRLEVDVAEGLPAVRFDRDAVIQVVFNLVDNALKYARQAGDKVVVLRCQARDGGVALSVRDRGPGVASRHLPKIFEAFYRGEDELTRTAKGTGIGLTLVKGLAERMGAVVSGRNAEEGGFEVSLFFRPAAAK